MNSTNKIPNQTGYLLLHETGAIISSGGDLENDESTAETIFNLISLTDNLDPTTFPKGGFNKVSICFKDFCYIICMSNKKIHVVKKTTAIGSNLSNNAGEPNLIDLQQASNNSING